MAASRKVHVVLTKYFMCINQGYYVIYLQNMKFVQLIHHSGCEVLLRAAIESKRLALSTVGIA